MLPRDARSEGLVDGMFGFFVGAAQARAAWAGAATSKLTPDASAEIRTVIEAGGFADIHDRPAASGAAKRRRRRALPTTKTEESAIAAAASAGESMSPKAGWSAPAATGMSAAL